MRKEVHLSSVGAVRSARSAVNQLSAAGVNVEIWSVGDGRVAIVLGLPWAELLVERLALEARTFAEQLRRAQTAEVARQATIATASAEGRERIQAEARAIYADYRRLRAEGLAHAEAIRRLRETEGTRIRDLNISDLTALVHAMGADTRREAREERRRQILALLAQGLPRKAIAKRLGLTRNQVSWALRYPRPEGGRHADAPRETAGPR